MREKQRPPYQNRWCMMTCVFMYCIWVHMIHEKNHYVCDAHISGENPASSLISSKYSCLITNIHTLPGDRYQWLVFSMWAYDSVVILSSSKEGIGGFYALILMSIFPLSYWLFMRKGEWHYLKSRLKYVFDPMLNILRCQWNKCKYVLCLWCFFL